LLIIGGAAGANGGECIAGDIAAGFCVKSETVAGGSICAGAGGGAGCAGARGISFTPAPLSLPLLPNISGPCPYRYFRRPLIFESSGENALLFCFFDSARPVIDFAIFRNVSAVLCLAETSAII
jgi:hypothetical protein